MLIITNVSIIRGQGRVCAELVTSQTALLQTLAPLCGDIPRVHLVTESHRTRLTLLLVLSSLVIITTRHIVYRDYGQLACFDFFSFSFSIPLALYLTLREIETCHLCFIGMIGVDLV